jgi:uncharacterized protein YciI
MRTFLLLLFLPLSVFAQEKYVIVFLNKNPGAPAITKEESTRLMDGHMKNITKLAAEKKLLAAGPFEGGGGIFILKTAPLDEIQQWLHSDPGIQAKRWNLEIFPYIPRQGGICPVGEKYEMTQYNFIRYDAIVSKSNATDFPVLLKQHDEYLVQIAKTGAVVSEAIFGDRDGGIMIVRGELQSDVIESDPAVVQGLIQFSLRKLHIAKGSFCE